MAATAERVYQRLDADQQRAARATFQRLVKIGSGVQDTRRRLPRAELDAGVVPAFARNRLLTLREDTVEISHEALLHARPRLREWIDADRNGLLIHQHLAETAQEWERGGRHAGLLYRGLRLGAVQEWHDLHPADATGLEREFVRASLELRTHSTRRLQGLVATLAVLLVSAVTAGIVAVDQRGQARDQAADNLSRQIALQSGDVREVDADLAILLAAESMLRSPTLDARAAGCAPSSTGR